MLSTTTMAASTARPAKRAASRLGLTLLSGLLLLGAGGTSGCAAMAGAALDAAVDSALGTDRCECAETQTVVVEERPATTTQVVYVQRSNPVVVQRRSTATVVYRR